MSRNRKPVSAQVLETTIVSDAVETVAEVAPVEIVVEVAPVETSEVEPEEVPAPVAPVETFVQVGSIVRSKKGDYDYAVLAISEKGIKLSWVGPEKPAYKYYREVSAKALVAGYLLVDAVTASTYKAQDEKWAGQSTYLAHRAAKVAAKIVATIPVEA